MSCNGTFKGTDIQAQNETDKMEYVRSSDKCQVIRKNVRSLVMIKILVSLNHHWKQEYIRVQKA